MPLTCWLWWMQVEVEVLLAVAALEGEGGQGESRITAGDITQRRKGGGEKNKTQEMALTQAARMKRMCQTCCSTI